MMLIQLKLLHGKVKVFINGCWVGISNNPIEFYKTLKIKNIKVLLIFIHLLYLIIKHLKFVYVMIVED
jgi:hypothetical protein